MNPATMSARDTMTGSEPSAAGSGRENEGGATAPAQKAEQALHDEWTDVPALAGWASSLASGLAFAAACAPWCACGWSEVRCDAWLAMATRCAGSMGGTHDMLAAAATACSGSTAIISQTKNVVSVRFIDEISIAWGLYVSRGLAAPECGQSGIVGQKNYTARP